MKLFSARTPKVPYRKAIVNDLLCHCSRMNVPRTSIGSRLCWASCFFAYQLAGILLKKCKTPKPWFSCQHTKVRVCVDISCNDIRFAQWLRPILQDLFLCTAVNREFLVVLCPWNTRIIWFIGVDRNDWMRDIGKVSTNPLDLVERSLSWCGSEWQHCHDGNHDVKSPQRYYPLKLSIQWLILLLYALCPQEKQNHQSLDDIPLPMELWS